MAEHTPEETGPRVCVLGIGQMGLENRESQRTDYAVAVDAAEGIDGSIARARDRWQNQIDFMDDRIADFEDRLDRKEAALIRQFSALEVSLQSLSSQSAWLASQVAGFNGGG